MKPEPIRFPESPDPFAFRFLFGGKFISVGRGRHIARTIDETEFILVASGLLGIRVGGRDRDAGAGQFLMLPAGVPHGGTRPYPRNLAFYWLHVRPDPERERTLPDVGTIARPASAFFWCDALLTEQRVPDNEAVCDRLLSLVLCEATRSSAPAVPSGDPSGGELLAAAARRRLRLDFRTPGYSTADLARQLGCNPDYLGRVYRDAFGETIVETIESLRLEHAETRLRITTASVSEIAYDAGFGSVAYFRRLWLRRHSVPPRAWRAAHSDAANMVVSV